MCQLFNTTQRFLFLAMVFIVTTPAIFWLCQQCCMMASIIKLTKEFGYKWILITFLRNVHHR